MVAGSQFDYEDVAQWKKHSNGSYYITFKANGIPIDNTTNDYALWICFSPNKTLQTDWTDFFVKNIEVYYQTPTYEN